MNNSIRLFTVILFILFLFLSNQQIFAKKPLTIQNLDSNIDYSGKIILKNGKQITSNGFYISNQSIFVNYLSTNNLDTIEISDVKKIKVKIGSYASNGFFWGLLLGGGLSYHFVLSESRSYKDYNKMLIDCFLISSASSIFWLSFGALYPKYKTYENNEKLSFQPFIKIDEINNQNALGITLKLQF